MRPPPVHHDETTKARPEDPDETTAVTTAIPAETTTNAPQDSPVTSDFSPVVPFVLVLSAAALEVIGISGRKNRSK